MSSHSAYSASHSDYSFLDYANKKNVVSPLKIIIFEKVIIYEIAASSWYRWYLSC